MHHLESSGLGLRRKILLHIDLPEGLADVYFDAAGGGLAMRTQQVTRNSALSVAVPVNGGFTVHLCPATAGATSCGA